MISKRVQSLKNKQGGKRCTEDQLAEAMVVVMKEMGWSYPQMMECPIPTYNVVVAILNERAEKEKKEMDKNKNKRMKK